MKQRRLDKFTNLVPLIAYLFFKDTLFTGGLGPRIKEFMPDLDNPVYRHW
jgi:hypothetical protein